MIANYQKDLFNQLQETINKVDALIEENRLLKSEIILLKENQQKEICSLKKEIAKSEALHKKEVEVLQLENIQLKKENKRLKDIINKDSSNSSKPPSSDGFKKITSTREKTENKLGGQKGHKGKVPILFDHPTEIIEHKESVCTCGGNVHYKGEYAAKQVVDVELVTHIKEHRVFQGVCSSCGAKVNGNFPEGVINTITYGNNLKSLIALLSVEGCISINRTRKIVCEMTDGLVNLAEGTIVNFNKELAKSLLPVIESLKDSLIASPVNHKDETGIRMNKHTRWLHVLSNSKRTLYYYHEKRGNDADNDAGVLPLYSGTLVHDHLKGLYRFTCAHAECNAHILRYLKGVMESNQRLWAQKMAELLTRANDDIKERKLNGESLFNKETLARYSKEYDQILENGFCEFLQSESPDYNGDDMKLLRRLKEYKKEHLLFLFDFNVPFDNNQAERDLRMIKAKAKISGCFRSEDGISTFAKIKSYTSTLKKNKRNIYQGIHLAFEGNPVIL